MFEYIRQRYGVSPEIGKEVDFEGKKGVIVKDLGNYVGVNFYSDKPYAISPLHPTYNLTFLESTGEIRKLSPSQKRYQAWLNYDGDYSFFEFVKYGIYKRLV